MSYFGIFRMEFEETIITFEINTVQPVKMQNFMLNETFNVKPKRTYLVKI